MLAHRAYPSPHLTPDAAGVYGGHITVFQNNIGACNGGFHHRIDSVVSHALREQAKCIGLQEIGEFEPRPNPRHGEYFLYLYPYKYAGVGVGIHQTWKNKVCGVDTGLKGRYMCVTLKGIFCDPAHTLAIISIYMPTGMDGISEEDPRFVLGESIVRRINHELATHTHAIVVGDFNEVKSPALDRARGGLAVADDISSPGRLVGRLNLTDCHRSLNPAIPLYTNAQKVVQAGSTYRSTARLDYCLVTRRLEPTNCKTMGVGWATTHRAVVTTLCLHDRQRPHTAPWRRPHLNTTEATPELWQQCCEVASSAILDDTAEGVQALFQAVQMDPSPEAVSLHFHKLMASTFEAVQSTLPAARARKQRKPKTQTRIGRSLLCAGAAMHLHLTTKLLIQERIRTSDAVWLEATQDKWLPRGVLYDEGWVNTEHLWSNEDLWLQIQADPETLNDWNSHLLAAYHRNKKKAKGMIRAKKYRKEIAELLANPRRRLKAIMCNKAGGPIDHVIANDGQRIEEKDALHEALHAHYAAVFTKPQPAESVQPPYLSEEQVREMVTAEKRRLFANFNTIAKDILRKQGAEEHYANLLLRPTKEELNEYFSHSSTSVTAGMDGINKRAWKQLIQDEQICVHILDTFDCFLQTARAPETVVILNCIAKRTNVPLEFKQLRPISLQNALLKIFTGLLAKRLTLIFHSHGTLDQAQEAYVKEGSTQNCVATFLSLLEDVHAPHRRAEGLYAVLYDLTAAYDNVVWPVLAVCLDRLSVPRRAIQLILSIVSSTTLRLQTHHGLTDPIKPTQGIPQGDPLSPILFAIVLDPLLCALRNSRTGYHLVQDEHVEQLAAKAYADDLTTFAQTEQDMHAQHRLVDLHMLWMNMTISPKTTVTAVKMVVPTEGHKRGKPVPIVPDFETPFLLHNGDGSDRVIQPTPIDQAFKYIGVMMRADLAASALEQQIYRRLNILCAINQQECRLNLGAARTFYNTYIFATMNHLFGARPLSNAFAGKLDRRVSACLSNVCATGLRLKVKPCVWVAFGVTLPSIQAAALIVDQTLHQARGTSDVARLTRLKLERVQGRRHESSPDRYVGVRRILSQPVFSLKRGKQFDASYSMTNVFQLKHTPQYGSEVGPMFQTQLVNTDLGQISCSYENISPFRMQPDDVDFDSLKKQVTVSTDGSPQCGRFGVLVIDRMLERECDTLVRLDEPALLAWLRSYLGTQNKGFFRAGNIPPSNQSYPPELFAILLAHVCIDLNHILAIITDSESAIEALRLARKHGKASRNAHGRAILNYILHCERLRESAGGQTEYIHQKSHTKDVFTLRAFANNAVDVLVRKTLCAFDAGPTPNVEAGDGAPGLTLLHNNFPVFGSVKRAVRTELRQQASLQWQTSPSQGNLVRVHPQRTQDLIDLVTKSKDPHHADLPRFLVRLLTETLPYMCRFPNSLPQAFVCAHCNEGVPITLSHPFACTVLKPTWESRLAALCQRICAALPHSPGRGAPVTADTLFGHICNRPEPEDPPLLDVVHAERSVFVADRIGIFSEELWLFLRTRLTPALTKRLRLGLVHILWETLDKI